MCYSQHQRPRSDDISEEDLANARLIAAAPDLLKALIALRDACEDNGDEGQFLGAMGAADKAIEKAIRDERGDHVA
jgi:hypothetical protein